MYFTSQLIQSDMLGKIQTSSSETLYTLACLENNLAYWDFSVLKNKSDLLNAIEESRFPIENKTNQGVL